MGRLSIRVLFVTVISLIVACSDDEVSRLC